MQLNDRNSLFTVHVYAHANESDISLEKETETSTGDKTNCSGLMYQQLSKSLQARFRGVEEFKVDCLSPLLRQEMEFP